MAVQYNRLCHQIANRNLLHTAASCALYFNARSKFFENGRLMSYVWVDAKEKIKKQLKDRVKDKKAVELEAESRRDWECAIGMYRSLDNSIELPIVWWTRDLSRSKKCMAGSPADTWLTQICDSVVSEIFEILNYELFQDRRVKYLFSPSRATCLLK